MQHTLNCNAPEISSFMNTHPNFREAFIAAEVYEKSALANWNTPVYQQVFL